MFNMFKKNVKKFAEPKQVITHVQMHSAIEKKMSEAAADKALQILRAKSGEDIINGNINYDRINNDKLAEAAAHMKLANRVMMKSLNNLVQMRTNNEKIDFSDNTVYSIVNTAKGLVCPVELDCAKDRQSLINVIIKEANTLMSMERNLLLVFMQYAKEDNQTVLVYA